VTIIQGLDLQVAGTPDEFGPERRSVTTLVGPAQAHLELARWLLAREAREAPNTCGVARAAEGACQKLLERLAKLITSGGCQAVLARALRLTGSDFQFLRGVEPGRAPGAYLEGLTARAEGTDPDQVERGLASLLAALLELTALFIGDYLKGRLLLDVWPDLPERELSPPAAP
jgi:hypothetical protein